VNLQLEPHIPGSSDVPIRPGMLDGITIMRYAHMYRERTSGGVEQYLRHLNEGLLQRHRMTILQMCLTRDEASDAIEIENVGFGRILWVPVAIRQTNSVLVDLPKRIAYLYRRTLQLQQHDATARRYAAASSLRGLFRLGHLRYKITILSDRLQQLLVTQNVDLLALHWLTYDTVALISRSLGVKIPFVFINHFDNARLSLPRTYQCIARAAGIGTVSSQGIPHRLRDRCVNLSDAIDIDLFSPSNGRPMQPPARPVVLLPARIGVGKGHYDLIEAARILIARKLDFDLCFAGAVESQSLRQELLRTAAAAGLEDRVRFLGEVSAKEIRDLFALSSVVVLPSYSEGMPRVILEAQAMKKPVVAYDCGGMPEAVLPNETGFLVKTGDVEALADRVNLLLKDHALRLRMGERGREFVSQRFSISALIQRHESFYLSALSRARTDRRGAVGAHSAGSPRDTPAAQTSRKGTAACI